MEFKKYPKRWFRHLLSAPVIYSVIIPVVIADVWIELYHRICFPLYGLEHVKRRNYIRIDRHKLKKLTLLQKLNCMYCGYVNGWLNYARDVAARTEKYWCSIKHENVEGFIPPDHHKNFLERKDFE